MKNLLKANFYRFSRTSLKILLIVLIGLLIFQFLSVLLLRVAESAVGVEVGTLGFNAFEASSLTMVIVVTISLMLIHSDKTSGLRRNKLISGYSKTKIFFANYLTLVIISFIGFLIIGIFIYLLYITLLNYDFNFGEAIIHFLQSSLVLFAYLSVAQFLSSFFKTTKGVAVLYAVVALGGTLFTSVVSIITLIGDNYTLFAITPGAYALLYKGNELTPTIHIIVAISSIVYSLIFLSLAYVIDKKSDTK